MKLITGLKLLFFLNHNGDIEFSKTDVLSMIHLALQG